MHTELIVKKGSGIKRGNIYEIFIVNAQDILTDLGIILIIDEMFEINNSIPKVFMETDCCPRAYIRGAFLGCGSVSDPERGYHLEFNLHSYNYAVEFAELLNTYELKAKIINRKSNFIVYLKESDKIVDLLNIIGAHHSLLQFENVRIIKEMRNNVNRIVNCETANLNKIVSAAMQQIRNIRWLDDYMGMDNLPKDLYEIAQIRLENEDLSLKEIGEMLDPPLGKSGVNHRFKKISHMVEELRGREVKRDG
jgi:DNA-binding protein WhiA